MRSLFRQPISRCSVGNRKAGGEDMRTFLFGCLFLSAMGAAYPDGWLELTESQRWQGVIILAVINLVYQMVVRPWLHRNMNDR